MSLQAWAEDLLRIPHAQEVIDLHVMDTLAAFFIGACTIEGRTLARSYDSTDRAEQAAAISAIARLSECDDIHLASCVTPGAIVIPVALAFAARAAEDDFRHAISAGYAAGLRLGIAIGGAQALASGVWPTLLAAPLMAAVTASAIRGYNAEQLAHAMALALAGASGRAGAPGKGRWLLLAEAVLKGLRASDAAGAGFRGDLSLLSEPWLAAQAGCDGFALNLPRPMPTMADVGFKPFPIARQGMNAVLVFQRVLGNGLDPDRIDAVEVFVPKMHVALLSRTVSADDRLSRLCNIGHQLACAALAPALLDDCQRSRVRNIPLADFARRVTVAPSADLDGHLPSRWAARVIVTAGRDRFDETIVSTPFDHDAPALAQELRPKWRRLLSPGDAGDLGCAASPAALWQIIERRASMASKGEG